MRVAILALLASTLSVGLLLCGRRAPAALVPLHTCTSQPVLRTGEVMGCEGWIEDTHASPIYGWRGLLKSMEWRDYRFVVPRERPPVGEWGYGERDADGVMLFKGMRR